MLAHLREVIIFFYVGDTIKTYDFITFNSLRLSNKIIEGINIYLCDKHDFRIKGE